MNFKNWLIKEGAIQVPFKVFEPIVTDYFNYLKNNIENPQRKTKTYSLDFSNTKYEFLKHLNPKLKVNYKGFKDNTVGHYVGEKADIAIHDDQTYEVRGIIELKYDLFKTYNTAITGIVHPAMYGLVEHEFAHFLQFLIDTNEYLKKNKTIPDSMDIIPIKAHGGSVPKRLTKYLMKKQDVDFYGVNLKTNKWIDHEKRPIEFQTNLISVLEEIQSNFVNSFLSGNLNPNYFSYPYEVIKTIKTKEAFEKNKNLIVGFLNNSIEKKKFILSSKKGQLRIDSDELTNVKKYNTELYNWYLNEIYKNFVTKDIEENKLNYLADVYFFSKNPLNKKRN